MKEMRTMSKSSTITRRTNAAAAWNIHPGEILREEFLKPMRMTPYALAKRLHVPVPRINDIVLEKRGITADTAIRLARFFGTSEEFWMNLQSGYDLRRAKHTGMRAVAAIRPMKEEGAA